MHPFSSLIAATLALVAFDSACAGDLPFTKGEPTAPSIASCDFYQSQLIGAFCENTFGGTVTVEEEQQRAKAPRGFGVTDNWRIDSLISAANVYVAPTSWLKLTIGSEYISDFSYFVQPPFASQTVRSNFAAWQTATAAVRLMDYNAEGFRAFISGVALVSYLPAYTTQGTSLGDRGEFAGELNAGVHWVLGNSNYSLNPLATLTFAHFTSSPQNEFASNVRVLLSQDVWGVAAGPVVTTAALNYHGVNGNGFQSQQYFAGAHLLVEPFRTSSTPVLKDVVANFDVMHSLGRAGTFYYWIPNADEMIYKGSVQFNFTY
jgi:hypothetical protein